MVEQVKDVHSPDVSEQMRAEWVDWWTPEDVCENHLESQVGRVTWRSRIGTMDLALKWQVVQSGSEYGDWFNDDSWCIVYIGSRRKSSGWCIFLIPRLAGVPCCDFLVAEGI